jgi:hypothetical protein
VVVSGIGELAPGVDSQVLNHDHHQQITSLYTISLVVLEGGEE